MRLVTAKFRSAVLGNGRSRGLDGLIGVALAAMCLTAVGAALRPWLGGNSLLPLLPRALGLVGGGTWTNPSGNLAGLATSPL